jgi:hypothetical protein
MTYHYTEAERLLELSETTIPDDEPMQAAVTRRAIGHALLALADAIRDASTPPHPVAQPGVVPGAGRPRTGGAR